MVKIVQKENKVLHEPAEEVGKELFGTAKLKKIIADMSGALAKEDDGVALAAPQIALPLRIFIIAGKIFTPDGEKKPKPDLVFINPKITKLSKTKQEMDEGCLSVRWYFGQVKRSDKATVEAYDINGKKFSRSGTGLVAQIFQHEIDHLNGHLFIEKAKNLREYSPEK
jgi:peptide deformylase